MSYLQLPKGLEDFQKAVVSFWFRVPQSSLDAARDQDSDDGQSDVNWYFPALLRTIPLVTFGSIETAVSGAYPVAPSYIGVDCTVNTLAVHLSMSNNSTFQMTPMETDGGGDGNAPQNLDVLQRTEAFYMSGNGSRPFHGDQISQLKVKADIWHHALISFDLTKPAVMKYSTAPQSAPPFPPATIMMSGGPTFMWAFDDEDKTDFSLSPCCAQIYNEQPSGSLVHPYGPIPLKEITTNNLILIAGGAWAFIQTWSPVPIKSSGNPVGIPSSAMFVDNVHHVEMAEFQLFTGVTLDTSDEKSRRAFIDYERDANGTPVKDKDGKFTLLPVAPVGQAPSDEHPDGQPAPAEKLLGKKPDILLHGTGNWIIGGNTGTTGVDYGADPPEVKPDGQFQPTGEIKAYTPDPSLSKSFTTRRKSSPVRLTVNARL